MSSDFFEQRRKRKPPRRADYRMPHVNSYLIVTEGSDTEPNYLNGLKKKILSYAGGTVDVIDRPLIRFSGKGEGTCRLVDETAEIWLYLHFEYSRAALHRNEWEKKLNQKFVQYHLNHGKYEKMMNSYFRNLIRWELLIRQLSKAYQIFMGTGYGQLPVRTSSGCTIHS